MTEKRIVNEKTGGEKGQKLQRYDLLPTWPLRLVSEVYGVGALKYAERNWERGYDWSLSYAALQRHANQFWSGERLDGETKCHHLASVVFHALALMEFERTHPELDDRPGVRSVDVPVAIDRGNPGGGDYMSPAQLLRQHMRPAQLLRQAAQHHLANPGTGARFSGIGFKDSDAE